MKVDHFVVGLPDTQGGMCWLAGYESDPTRFYTPRLAKTFRTVKGAMAAIRRAKETHPFQERTYKIIRASEMSEYNKPKK